MVRGYMDRDWMLRRIRERLAELKAQYRDAVNDRDSSPKYAALKRNKALRDIRILRLLEECVESAEKISVTDPDSVRGFDMLTEPRRYR